MLDTGLLLSGAVIAVVAWFVARWTIAKVEEDGSPLAPNDSLDLLLWAGMAGLLAGRAAAVLLDDPDSLRSLRSFLVIRGGVEMWPGAAIAAGVLAVTLHRRRVAVLATAAVLTPVAVTAYATFEATCVVREGCYGPRSPIGLRPDGLSEPTVPLGLLVGGFLAVVAVLLARRATWPAHTHLLVAIGSVAGLRSVASVWLPRIGDELTRQHRESIVVTVLAVAGLLAVHLTSRSAAVR